jgi:hypothetical protein
MSIFHILGFGGAKSQANTNNTQISMIVGDNFKYNKIRYDTPF